MSMLVGAQTAVAVFSGAAPQILAAMAAAYWRTSGDDCPSQSSSCRGGLLACCRPNTCRDRCGALEGAARRVLGAELKLLSWFFRGDSFDSWGGAAAK
jgi:hypothetical protein